jgi:hypothetical protein
MHDPFHHAMDHTSNVLERLEKAMNKHFFEIIEMKIIKSDCLHIQIIDP